MQPSNDNVGLFRWPAAFRPWRWLATTWFLCHSCGCNYSDPTADLSQSDEARILPVNVTAAVLSENTYQSQSFFGRVKPNRTSSLAFSKGGLISNVPVSIGDTVEESTVLAELDADAIEQQQTSLDQRLKTANTEVERLLSSSFRSQENQRQISVLQQEIATLNTQRNELDAELEKGQIVAPSNGVVLQIAANIGDSIPAGRPVIKIAASGPPIIEVDIPNSFASQLNPEQAVWIQKDGEKTQATLATKSPELGPSRAVRIKLNIPEQENSTAWTFGEAVEILFWNQTSNSGYWLPYSALQGEADGLWSAFVVENDGEQQVVSRRSLELLQLADEHALVTGSIQAGDLVIRDGLNRVVAGQQVDTKVVTTDFQPPQPPGAGE